HRPTSATRSAARAITRRPNPCSSALTIGSARSRTPSRPAGAATPAQRWCACTPPRDAPIRSRGCRRSGEAKVRLPIHRQSARHAMRYQAAEVAGGVVGQRAHVVGELIDDRRGKHDAVEERVALLEDRGRRVEQRAAKYRLELERVVGGELLVGIAVVIDEIAKV